MCVFCALFVLFYRISFSDCFPAFFFLSFFTLIQYCSTTFVIPLRTRKYGTPPGGVLRTRKYREIYTHDSEGRTIMCVCVCVCFTHGFQVILKKKYMSETLLPPGVPRVTGQEWYQQQVRKCAMLKRAFCSNLCYAPVCLSPVTHQY